MARWAAPDTEALISVISPHSEAVIGHAACAGPADVDRAVGAARVAFDTGPWPRMQPAERIEAIRRLAAIYKERRADMAALISAEIGSPITFAKMAQVRLPLTIMSAFCGLAGSYQWQQARPGLYGKDIRIVKQPVGVIAAVVPWNMPQFLTVCQDRAGAVGRLFGGAQASARVGARCPATGRSGRAGRPSARRIERRARGSRGR